MPRDDYDYASELYKDPNAAIARVKREVVDEITTAYRQHTGAQQFWAGFARDYPDLAKDVDVAELMMNRNMQELASMPVPDAAARIAELTRAKLGRDGQNDADLTPLERDNQVMNGFPQHGDAYGAASARPRIDPETGHRAGSLGNYIKQRKAARYEASRMRTGKATAE